MSSLYVNGDSWSFATKECDFPTWPELVAKELDLDLLNDSLGCGSNSRIIDCVKNRYLIGLRPKLMIFGLTSHHRYHLPAADLGSWVIGPVVALHEHTGTNNEQIKDFFFRHCYSDLDSMYRYYRDIWSIHELCKSQNIPYFCFQAWDEDINNQNILKSEKSIRDYVENSIGPGFVASLYIDALSSLKNLKEEWNYHEDPISSFLTIDDYDETQHPNRSGHEKIAKQVLKLLQDYDLI